MTRALILHDGDLVATGTYRSGRSDRPEYMLMRDLIGPLYGTGSGLSMMVPMGYVTDRYSLPRTLSLWQAKHIEHLGPALLHDWLYDAGLVPRGLCDYALRLAMDEADVSWRHRWLAWMGTRMGGWTGYGKPTPHNYELVQMVQKNGGLAWLMDSKLERTGWAYGALNLTRQRAGLPIIPSPNFEVAA